MFTDLQVAGVGLTEAEARTQRLDLQTAVLPLEYLPRTRVAWDLATVEGLRLAAQAFRTDVTRLSCCAG